MDASLLLWGMLFGSVGPVFFTYGKRQKAVVPLIAGVSLFILPYLISNVYALVAAGIVLIVLPDFCNNLKRVSLRCVDDLPVL